MNKLIVLLVALLVSASSFAHDPFVRTGGGYGNGGRGYQDPHQYQRNHDHRGPSLGQVVGAAVVLGAVAVVLDRALPQQQTGVVVYTAPPEIICRNMFVPVTDQFGRPLYDRYSGQPLTVERRFCQQM